MSACLPVTAKLDPDHISIEARSALRAERTEPMVGRRRQALDVVRDRTQFTADQLITYNQLRFYYNLSSDILMHLCSLTTQGAL